jgi:hypothetical protein
MSNVGIFLIQHDDKLVEMIEEPYDSEDLLQTLLAKYPSLLAGNQIDPKAPRRWLFIERECGVPGEESGGDRWRIDHLFIDQDAIPTIVEVKRSTDTGIRRKIVGQMLDYAANATKHWPVSLMRERFAATCARSGLDPEEELAGFLGEDGDSETFWETANKNLQEGRIRLLFVADKIPPELQRIVEFLNKQMDRTEVLAIEIKQFVGQKSKGLVPRVIGQTVEALEKKPPGHGARTTEAEFFRVLEEKTSSAEANVARMILDWSKQNFSYINWGAASFVPMLEYDSPHAFSPIDVRKSKGGRVVVRFGYIMDKNPPFDTDVKRLDLLGRLNEIPGVTLSQDNISKFPQIPISTLVSDNSVEQFLKVLAWTIEEVKAAQNQADLLADSAKP